MGPDRHPGHQLGRAPGGVEVSRARMASTSGLKCTCRPPFLHIDHVPHQVRCVKHWFQVPSLETIAPREPVRGGVR